MTVYGLNGIENFAQSVGTGLAPVRNKLHIKSGQRTTARVVPTVAYIFSFDKTQSPSDEGAVERSETEGEKAIKIKFSLSLPQSFFLWKNDSPLKDGAEARI